MNTSVKYARGSPPTQSWRLRLGVLVMTLTTGCFGPSSPLDDSEMLPSEEDTGASPAASLSALSSPDAGSLPVNDCDASDCNIDPLAARPDGQISCPTGQCDPDPNGLGIYVVEGSNYCFKANGVPLFCPEAFINTPEGVILRFREPEHINMLQEVAVSATVQEEGRLPLGVSLLSVQANASKLTVTYAYQGQQYVLQGADLKKLTLFLELTDRSSSAEIDPFYIYQVRLEPRAGDLSAAVPVDRYTLTYRHTPASPWQTHCSDTQRPGGTVSFLPDKVVNGLNAAVADVANVTTMGCESGAIATCLRWGYTPWAPDGGPLDSVTRARRAYLYRSCLHAKRAAYFVGFGDLKSYTATGTPILKRDQFGIGIHQDDIHGENIEALWSPKGAVCLNPENRRHPEIPLASLHGLPSCGSPPVWTTKGKLATSPAPPG